MAQSKKVNTITIDSATVDKISIKVSAIMTEFDCGFSELPNIKISKISEEETNINGMHINECDLYCVGVDIPFSNDLILNEQGELIVVGDDSDKYVINDQGELEYIYCDI